MPRKKLPILPDYSERALAIAQSYNPDQMLPIQCSHWTMRGTGTEKWRFLLNRPDGDFYMVLFRLIPQVLGAKKTGCKLNLLSKYNAQNMLMGVAARDHQVSNASDNFVQQKLSFLRPWIDAYWYELELYRAIVRIANEQGFSIPASVQDPRKAWGITLLSELACQKSIGSRRKLTNNLQFQKLQATKQQPLRADPTERELMLDLAHRLTQKPDSEAKLPNSERRSRGLLRKSVRQALENYKVSIKNLAVYTDKEGDISMVKELKDGKLAIVSERGKIQPLKLVFMPSG